MYPELAASQFVDYMAILKGLGEPRERARRVSEVLEMVALQEAAHRKIKGFSGGMKRRVGIAHALVNDPSVLIVDEPTAGLDPEERIRFRNLLVNLAADRTVMMDRLVEAERGLTIVSMLHLTDGIQYRLVGPSAAGHPTAEPARPSLEDGYVWLMKSAG